MYLWSYPSTLCLDEPIPTFLVSLIEQIASDNIRPEREPFGSGSALGALSSTCTAPFAAVMFHCYHQSIVLCYYSHCAVTIILLCHSCDRPFSCYFTTIMLLASYSAAHLSSDFADVIQLCYSQAFPLSYCFASVILLCQCHFTLPLS